MKHEPKYFADPDNSSSAHIYGNTVRMLREGGPWRTGEDEPFHFDFYRPASPAAPNKIRTKPGTALIYLEEVYEPDFKVSNVKWTGTIIKHMVTQGFSTEQIKNALSDPANVGGSFYRYIRLKDETLLERYITKSSPSAQPPNTTTVGTVLGGWKVVGEFTVKERDAKTLLSHLMIVGGTTVPRIKAKKVIYGPKVETVLKALTEAGMVSVTKEPFADPRGRMRESNVVRVADAGAVSLMLSADNLPEEDRPLWELLDQSHSWKRAKYFDFTSLGELLSLNPVSPQICSQAAQKADERPAELRTTKELDDWPEVPAVVEPKFTFEESELFWAALFEDSQPNPDDVTRQLLAARRATVT